MARRKDGLHYNGTRQSLLDVRGMTQRKRKYKRLQTDRIIETVEKLDQRIARRFPASSLRQLCEDLVIVSKTAHQRVEEFRHPLTGLRILSGVFIVAILIGTISVFISLSKNTASLNAVEFIQVLEAGINDVVLIGAAIFFLVTLEIRTKRRRVLEAIHELRSIAHIIDMHQLTKDPVYVVSEGRVAGMASERRMTPFELSRYLDYCSEMLSLCGKVAAVYIEEVNDSVVIAAVNEIENLTTGLSRKIWQKMLILEHQIKRGERTDLAEPRFGDERDTLRNSRGEPV